MRNRVVSFAWNHQGLGHASRLVAVHSVLRDKGWASLFLVEHPQALIGAYDFPQVTMPKHQESLVGDTWWSARDDASGQSRELADTIVAACTAPDDVILHDVVIYRPLYDWAVRNGRSQLLIHRARKDR